MHKIAGALCALTMLVACTDGSPEGAGPRPSSAPASATSPSSPSPSEGLADRDRDESCVSGGQTVWKTGNKSVRMLLTPCRVEVGEHPEVTLVNTGEGRLGYGPGFALERKTPSGWRVVNRRQGFPLPLFYLKENERSEPEEVAVYLKTPRAVRLEPGRYRVTKSLQLTPGRPRPPTMEVGAHFRVVD